MTLSYCIARDCGKQFDISIPEPRTNLRSFWQRYCPECRTKGNAGTPAIVNIPAKDMIRPYGPGKFSTILDSYVYSVSLDGGCDEEEGNVSECGEWYGIMRNGRMIFRDHDPMLETLNTAEQEKLTSSAGVILREDSNGFVYVTYYDTDEALELAWSQIADSFTDGPEQD
jgi:hypothetical protein